MNAVALLDESTRAVEVPSTHRADPEPMEEDRAAELVPELLVELQTLLAEALADVLLAG